MALALLLTHPVHVRMYNAHVSSKRIVTGEGLFFRTQMAPDLLLPCIVYRVFVSGKVVGSGKDRIARLARARVDTVASVRACLRVSQGQIG